MGGHDELINPSSDQFHGTGHETGPGCRHRVPLIGVNPNTEHAGPGTRIGGHFLDGSVAGIAASAKHHVGSLVQGLARGGSTPFRIIECDRQVARVVGRNHLNLRIDITGTQGKAFPECHHRRYEVGAQDGGNGTGSG